MHLGLGKSIVLGHSKPLGVSTQGSGMGPNPRLSPIVEDIYLGEMESTTYTSISMASYNEGMSEDMHKVRFEYLCSIQSSFTYTTIRGGHNYM